MSEKEPLEDVVRRFKRGGLNFTMTMPPRIVKLGATQVRKMLRTRTQAQLVEDSSSEHEEEVHMATVYIVP